MIDTVAVQYRIGVDEMRLTIWEKTSTTKPGSRASLQRNGYRDTHLGKRTPVIEDYCHE